MIIGLYFCPCKVCVVRSHFTMLHRINDGMAACLLQYMSSSKFFHTSQGIVFWGKVVLFISKSEPGSLLIFAIHFKALSLSMVQGQGKNEAILINILNSFSLCFSPIRIMTLQNTAIPTPPPPPPPPHLKPVAKLSCAKNNY